MRELTAKIKRYFSGSSSVGFWHLPVGYDREDYSNPHFYYLDLSEKLKYKGPYNGGCIPLLDYKGDIGLQYNPCAVAQYGLGALYRFGRTGDKDSYDRFISTTEWLSANLKKESNLYLWLYDFDLDAYSVKAPWPSALAQAQGISVLARAYRIAGREEYAEKSLKAFQSLLVKVQDGGLRRETEEGPIYEEVPTSRLSCILDGFMFTLFGLMDLHLFTGYVKALEEFNLAVGTLERILPRYDMRFWSRADLYAEHPKMIASQFYHRLHIDQLDVLHRITGKDRFRYYSEKWNRHLENSLFRAAAFAYKAAFKLFYY